MDTIIPVVIVTFIGLLILIAVLLAHEVSTIRKRLEEAHKERRDAVKRLSNVSTFIREIETGNNYNETMPMRAIAGKLKTLIGRVS